jgi:hypothetical protein
MTTELPLSLLILRFFTHFCETLSSYRKKSAAFETRSKLLFQLKTTYLSDKPLIEHRMAHFWNLFVHGLFVTLSNHDVSAKSIGTDNRSSCNAK